LEFGWIVVLDFIGSQPHSEDLVPEAESGWVVYLIENDAAFLVEGRHSMPRRRIRWDLRRHPLLRGPLECLKGEMD